MPTPAWIQYLLPKQALTVAAGALARREAGRATTWAIRRFIARYQVDMTEAAQPDPAAYPSFNAFFTRALRDGVRPLAAEGWICPVDGAISRFGPIGGDRIVQAKGHDYSATALLGGDPTLAAGFQGGHYATIYLSPRDYHRIHMPAAGRLLRMIHVPGALFSVNPTTVAAVPGLFARNERVVCLFEGDDGRPFALVLVGATIVGSMATVWHGVVSPPRPGGVREWRYDTNGQAVRLARGAEMGRFMLGSTVVLLWPPGPLRFAGRWAAGASVRLGEPMADDGAPHHVRPPPQA